LIKISPPVLQLCGVRASKSLCFNHLETGMTYRNTKTYTIKSNVKRFISMYKLYSNYYLASVYIQSIMLQIRAWRHVGFHAKYLVLSHFNQERNVWANFSQCFQQRVPWTIRSAVPELLHADRQTVCTWDTIEGRMTGWGMYWTGFRMNWGPFEVNTLAITCNTKILRQES
jgi:hypothetical protein